MSGLCEEHSHLFYPKDINLPPRKLLSRAKHAAEEQQQQNLSPIIFDEDAADPDPYSRDEFRMYEFKIRRCMRSRSHDWTDCPFAHPGEKARRRDPRRFHYSGNPCADFRHGSCPRGEACEFAHGVFECWLHPARYRTHACKDGRSCTRKVCFFAHTPRQLRILPLSSSSQGSDPGSPTATGSGSGEGSSSPVSVPSSNHQSCCAFCHQMGSSSASSLSPTSTLLARSYSSPPMSPTLSPPITPIKLSTASKLKKKNMSLSEYLSYKNAVMELITALEEVNLTEQEQEQFQEQYQEGFYQEQYQEPEQFFLSPRPNSTRTTTRPRERDAGAPDFDWVNELVM